MPFHSLNLKTSLSQLSRCVQTHKLSVFDPKEGWSLKESVYLEGTPVDFYERVRRYFATCLRQNGQDKKYWSKISVLLKHIKLASKLVHHSNSALMKETFQREIYRITFYSIVLINHARKTQVSYFKSLSEKKIL